MENVNEIGKPPLSPNTPGEVTKFSPEADSPAPASEMQRLEMLNEISRVVSATLDLRTLYDTMYHQVSRIMDTSMFFIALSGAEGSIINLPYVREFGNLSLDVDAPSDKSVTNLVCEQGQPLLFHTDKQYEDFAKANGLPVIVLGDDSRGEGEGKIYVPLNTGSRTIGTLSVQSIRPHAYSQDDLDTLAVIASQAAVAIENARLYESSVIARERLQSQLRVAEMVNQSLNLQTVLDAILQGVLEVMPCHLAAILLPNYNEAVLDTAGIVGQIADHRRSNFKVPFGHGVTGRVFETAEPLNVPDVLAFPDYVEGSEDVRSEIAVPLKRGDAVLGVLNVERSEINGFSDDDVTLLTLFASQAATAIENARLYSTSVDSGRRLQTLLDVAQAINGSLDLDAVLEAVLDGIADVVPYQFACVMLPDDKHQFLRMARIKGAVGSPDSDYRLKLGEGIVGRVFVTGEPRLVADVRSTPEYVGSKDIGSMAALPLKHGNTVIGVLDVERCDAQAFSSDDIRLLTIFASQAASAIVNARLFEREQRRVTELQTIETIVQAMTSQHDTVSLAVAVDRELGRLVAYDACRIFLLDERGETLEPVDFPGAHVPSGFPLNPVKNGEGIQGWVAQHAKAALVDDLRYDERTSAETRKRGAPGSAIASPLLHEGTVLGVIILGKEGAQAFDVNDLRLLEIVSAQMAIALDRCRLYERLRLQALTDGLTGLSNRRYLMDRLNEEQSRARRSGHPVSALMLDVDDFKRFNDTHGHDCGDDVLREMADLLRRELRTEDIVARHGGEEFSIVLPEVSLEGAAIVAERIRSLIASRRVVPELETGAVRVSIGAAEIQHGESGTGLISRADMAMYKAKRAGGNGVCVVQNGRFELLTRPRSQRHHSPQEPGLAATA